MADQTHDDVMKLAETLLDQPRHVRFLRSLDEAKGKAQTIKDVEADPYLQAGREVLVFSCPVCTNVAALSGEGRHQCRSCHTWLRVRRKQ